MLFSSHPRTHYEKAPAREVICQLRFPTILSINSVEPADFQEVIRGEFPQYARRQDNLPPRMVEGRPQAQPPMTNYHFLSADGKWKLNVTREFIALSTLHYSGWENFARMLDKPLASFIQIYQPAYFQRVGLRYINLFSRSALSLEDAAWSELFNPAYLGPLQESDVREEAVLGCGCDFQVKLDSSCQVKIHSGVGRMKTPLPGGDEKEIRFMLDLDLSMGGNVPCTLAAASLETLHGHGTRIFEGAITEQLRQALEPRC